MKVKIIIPIITLFCLGCRTMKVSEVKVLNQSYYLSENEESVVPGINSENEEVELCFYSFDKGILSGRVSTQRGNEPLAHALFFYGTDLGNEIIKLSEPIGECDSNGVFSVPIDQEFSYVVFHYVSFEPKIIRVK